MKRTISLLLILSILVSCMALVSCSNDGVPDGMQLATAEGEPFVLYVPEGFTVNTASGISGAYYSQVENSLMVTARYYTPSNTEMTIDEYMSFCADSYLTTLQGFEKTGEIAGDTLGGADARRLTYKMTAKDKEYNVAQISTKYNGDFVSLSLYATVEGMSVYEDFITAILKNFTLVEKSETLGDEYIDKKTPEGMKIASSDILEYRFYVPRSWVCSSKSAMSEAYYPESEKTNVTVTSYSPDKDISLQDYYEICIEEYKETINGFSNLTVTNDFKVADKDAISFTYTAEYDGVVYKLRQVILWAGQNGLFYTFTYTATEQNFELHMADFEAMLSEFTFR